MDSISVWIRVLKASNAILLLGCFPTTSIAWEHIFKKLNERRKQKRREAAERLPKRNQGIKRQVEEIQMEGVRPSRRDILTQVVFTNL